jgi:hypothetical protein
MFLASLLLWLTAAGLKSGNSVWSPGFAMQMTASLSGSAAGVEQELWLSSSFAWCLQHPPSARYCCCMVLRSRDAAGHGITSPELSCVLQLGKILDALELVAHPLLSPCVTFFFLHYV